MATGLIYTRHLTGRFGIFGVSLTEIWWRWAITSMIMPCPPIPEQSSDHRLVFGFLISGLQRYRMDGEDLILRGGQGIRFLPGSVYSSADLPEQRGEFFWLVIHVPERRPVQLPGFHKEAAHAWWQRATDAQLPRRFPLSAEIRADLVRLIQSDVTNMDDKVRMPQPHPAKSFKIVAKRVDTTSINFSPS